MTEIIYHLGLHKTATGTLQRQFFPRCPDIQLLTTKLPEMKSFMEMVTRKDPLYFNPKLCLEIITPLLSEDKPNIFSNESFSGPPYAGLIEKGLDHRSSVLENLQSVFPEAKIIIVLRRQDTLARSLYRQYLKAGGTRNINRFYGFDKKYSLPLFSLDRFFFTKYIDAVSKAFPNGNLFLLFEEFIDDEISFLKKITNFIGMDFPNIKLKKENVTTLGPTGLEVTRILNHLFRNLNNPGGIFPGIPKYHDKSFKFTSPLSIVHDRWPKYGKSKTTSTLFKVSEGILNMTNQDNRDLDNKYDLNMKKYGYY